MAYTTIDKPDDYFNTVLWTGTGDPTTSVTGVNFQPDFVWIKNRNVADDHMLFDAVRGVTKRLFSNSTAAEGTDVQTLTSFDSDGFTTGNNRATGGDAGNGMVSWNWLGSNGTVTNTDGSISSTVSANTTSGFSIVSYTGTGAVPVTVGHGLGVIPEVLIIKNRTNAYDWVVYHKDLGNTGGLFLNTTSAFTTDADLFNNTSPTSSVVTFSNSTKTNQGSANHIMYAFNSVKGFSKFGSYVSNNNADGTFVYTGFKPAFLLLKNITTGSTGWEMYDNKRTPNNVANLFLRANTSGTDVSSDRLDILSNGFKLRQVGDTNYNSDVIIYMAFAENPFVTSTGIPTTAR
jgi:hypothetical protein